MTSLYTTLLVAAWLTILTTTSAHIIVEVNHQVALEVVSAEIIRVFRCDLGCNVSEAIQDRRSLVVLDEARDPSVRYEVSTLGDTVIVHTDFLQAAASRSLGTVHFSHNGQPLLEGTSWSIDANTVAQEWALQPLEAIYGGGQYVNGLLNYRSAPIRMEQFNTEAAVPFVLSSHNYGILWDLYGETLMNQPQQERRLNETFQGVFTPSTNGTHWFLMQACHEVFGCWNDQVSLKLLDPTDSHPGLVCEHSLANLPHSVACRVGGLRQGTKYWVLYEGSHPERRLYVTNVDTHNKLTFHTKASKVIDYYFMASSKGTIDGVIHNYRRLTGAAYLYERWVYGFWQCKEHYHNQTELVEAANKFRQLRIPVDAFVQDWRYWGDLGWGPQWDPKLYPSPQAMIQSLREAHIHFMVSTWSWFDKQTRFYKEMEQTGALIENSTYMDAWNPTAQGLFYKYLEEAHFSIGADAIWLDATEPELPVQLGKKIYLGTGDEYANTFSLMVAKAVYDGLVKKYPNRRVFSLTRSSFAGQQRYGAALWSGDTTGSWDSLRRQIAMSLNYQLSGIPYWSMDTGGFYRPVNQYTSNDYHQLLIRWFQFAVFTPIFRVHGDNSDTELWNYGSDVQNTIVQTAIRFRYRLLEYIYSGFRRVETEHYTMQRALIFDFGNDLKGREIADQFMFGDSFLVAPIHTSNSSRSIYMPHLSTGIWRCFYSGNELEGGQWLEFNNFTIARIPLFVRSSIVVLGPDGRQHVDDLLGGALEVRVYDGADSRFDLFEDDGISKDPNRVTFNISFSWNEQARNLTVGEAAGATTRTINIILVRPGQGVGLDPTNRPDASLAYNGTSISVNLPTQLSEEAEASKL